MSVSESRALQGRVSTGTVVAGGGAPVDLTKAALARCNEIVAASAGGTRVEVRFPTGFSEQAQSILRMLAAAAESTRQILRPLPAGNVRVYLLPLGTRPAAFTYNFSYAEGTYQTLLLIADTDRSIDCRTHFDVCSEVFGTAPHELTHTAVSRLVGDEGTRWFEDGLAEYVAWRVAAEHAPAVAERMILDRSPEAALQCKGVRPALFRWEHAPVDESRVNDAGWAWEMNSLYGASFQLVRLLIEEARRSGVDDPLGAVLRSLAEFRERRGKAAGGADFLSAVTSAARVDVRRLGALDAATRQALVAKAAGELAGAGDPYHEFHALNVLACVDGPTNTPTLGILLDTALDERRDELTRRLAATALTLRMSRRDADKVFAELTEAGRVRRAGSADAAKKLLQTLSLKPGTSIK